MNCKPINVTIIAVYAPVNPSTTAASQSNDKFYSYLQDTLDKVSSSNMIIFMEDFNARIGSAEYNISLQTVSPFATDSRTNNGERLVNFCVANNVVISNTFSTQTSSSKIMDASENQEVAHVRLHAGEQ